MPTDMAITQQYSVAAILPLEDASGNPITGQAQIDGAGTQIEFDYIQDAGPEWPAPEGAAGDEFIEATAANGTLVQYPKNTQTIDGVTGTVKPGGGGGGGGHKLKFTVLEWGKTLATTIPPLQGALVLCVIPIGQNVTSAEDGWYYLLGRISSAITYSAKGNEVVTVEIEVTGTSATASGDGNTALTWAPGSIDQVGGSAMTPVALEATDLTALKSGQIVVK